MNLWMQSLVKFYFLPIIRTGNGLECVNAKSGHSFQNDCTWKQGFKLSGQCSFCSTNLPLASTGWVQSTELSYPLSTVKAVCILLAQQHQNFFLKKQFEPGAAGSRSKYANYCASMLPCGRCLSFSAPRCARVKILSAEQNEPGMTINF